jgi:ComEC/Rec2-related protein
LFKRTHALTNLLPAIHCALIVGWAGALFYAALAGFSLPTQRALIMVTVFTLATVLGRARQLWSALGLAFCLVLLWDPVAGRSLGFWLSFGAVFLILWSIGGEVVRRTVAQRWFTVQLSLFAGLAPILLWSVHSVSLVSFITNLIAIPVVGFVIVPLCLVWAGLWTVFGDQVAFLLQAAAVITDLVMWLLQELAYLRYSTWQVGIRSLSSMLLALVGVAWLMSPGLPGRLWGGVLMLPILLPQVQGIGMYVMGPTSGRVVLHEQGKMLSISRSHWPQPIADWQSGLLENWGVHLPDNVPLVGSKTLWLDPGVVITELSIQQGKLATRVVSSVHYHSLCGLTAQYSDLKLRVWTAQAAGEHCVLEFHWGQSRWLYWPVAKLAAQQALVKNLAGEQFTGIILDLGGGRHLDSGVFNLLANNGTLVTTKRIPELALAEKPVRGIRLHTVASDGYFYANEVGDWAEDSDVSAKM